MAKALKIAAISAGGLVGVMLLVVGVVAASFDPNDYKATIIKLVQEKTQRTLSIPGKIKLSFYPKIGADLGQISLSEHAGKAEFAAVQSARVSLALIPLLSKNLVVDRIDIEGLRANIVRNADGSLNIDDLLSKDEKKSEQIKFAIDSIKIGNASLHFDDRKEGRVLELSHVNIDSGEVANGVPSKLALSANVKANKPAIATAVTVKTGFTIDTVNRHFVLKGLETSLSGKFAEYEKLELSAAGDADLDLAKDKFALEKLTLTAAAKNGPQSIDAKLSLPSFNGNLKDVKLPGLSLDLAIKDSGLDAKAKLSGSVSADLDKMLVRAPELQLSVDGKKGELPLVAKLGVGIDADLNKQIINSSLKGKLDDSNIEGKVGVHGFSPAQLDFALNIDAIDLARYQSKAPAATANAPEAPIDLSGLKGLHAKGSIQIGKLLAAGMQVTNLAATLNAGGGTLALSPVTAKLYDGSMNSSLKLEFGATPATPRIVVNSALTGVKVGPLLKDAIKKQVLEGTGDVNIDVSTQGATVSAMRRALGGNAKIRLADGAVSGFNLAKIIREAKATLGGGAAKAGTSAAADKTDFTEMGASFHILNGVAHNEDLSAKTPLFRIGGAGDIDLGKNALNYQVKTTVVASLQGQGGPELQALKGVTVPVRLDGPLEAVNWHIDFAAMATDSVKTKVQDKLKDTLKGLFGK